MSKGRKMASVAGLTVGLIGLLSAVVPSHALADSPWDRPELEIGCTVEAVVDFEAGLAGGHEENDDSPWD